MSVVAPRLTVERRLLKEHALVIACDEVGRGALAGPVAVGAAVMDAAGARRRIPEGLRDSKLVAEHRRPDVAARAAAWVGASAVGWASAAEIDEVGIIRALGLAALRAIADLRAAGIVPEEAIVILDGNHDYITPTADPGAPVIVRVKADRDCASASAATFRWVAWGRRRKSRRPWPGWPRPRPRTSRGRCSQWTAAARSEAVRRGRWCAWARAGAVRRSAGGDGEQRARAGASEARRGRRLPQGLR